MSPSLGLISEQALVHDASQFLKRRIAIIEKTIYCTAPFAPWNVRMLKLKFALNLGLIQKVNYRLKF